MKELPVCNHIKDNGTRCRGIAVRGHNFCYFHLRHHRPGPLPGNKQYRAPVLDTYAGLKLQIHQIIQAVATGNVDLKAAALMLSGLRLASRFGDHPCVAHPVDGCVEIPSPMLHELNLSNPQVTEQEPVSSAECGVGLPGPMGDATHRSDPATSPIPPDITPEELSRLSETNPELFTLPGEK